MPYKHLNGKHLKGFTLIELLVVIIIIGIFFSLITLTLTDTSDDSVKQESLRIKALLKQAQQKSLFENKNIGLYFFTRGYDFIERSEIEDPNDSSQTITLYSSMGADNNSYRKRTLPEKMQLTLSVGDSGIDILNDYPSAESIEADTLKPHVWFYNSGENIPFSVDLIFANKFQQTIETNEIGKVSIGAIEYYE